MPQIPKEIVSGVGFGVAVGPDGSVLLTSNGRNANEDNIFLLQDLNGDGDYRDEGETTVWQSRAVSGDVPDRPRAVAFAPRDLVVAVAEPGTLLLLAIGFLSMAGMAGFSGRRRSRVKNSD